MNGQLNNPEDININEEFVEKLHPKNIDKVRKRKQTHHYLHLHYKAQPRTFKQLRMLGILEIRKRYQLLIPRIQNGAIVQSL